jgi:hypothetical protein
MSGLSLYLGTVMKVWYVLFIIIFRNCSEGVVCLVYHYIEELFWRCGMSCFSLYLGTVLKVWYVLFIFIYRNCSEGVVCLVYRLYLTRHTTPSEQFLNIMKNKTYHTFRTVPQYNDKQDIPHLQDSS